MERQRSPSVACVDRQMSARRTGKAFFIASAVANILEPPSAVVEATVLPCETFDVFFPRRTHLTVDRLVACSQENTCAREVYPENGACEGLCKPEARLGTRVHRRPQEKTQSRLEEGKPEGDLPCVPADENENEHLGDDWTGVSFDDQSRCLAICQCMVMRLYTAASSGLTRLPRDTHGPSCTDSRKAVENRWVGWVRLALLMNGSCPLALKFAQNRVQQLGEEVKKLISHIANGCVCSIPRRKARGRVHNDEQEARRGGEETGIESDKDAGHRNVETFLVKTVNAERGDGTKRRWINAKTQEGSPEGHSRFGFQDQCSCEHLHAGGEVEDSCATVFLETWNKLKEELASVKHLLEVHPKCGDLWAYRRYVCRTIVCSLLCLAGPKEPVSQRCSHSGDFQIHPNNLSDARSEVVSGTSKMRSEEPVETFSTGNSNICDPGDADICRGADCTSVSEDNDKRACVRELSQRGADASDNHDWVRWMTAELSDFLDTELALVAEHAAQRPHSYQAWEHFAKIEQEVKTLFRRFPVCGMHTGALGPSAVQRGDREQCFPTGGAKEQTALEELRYRIMQQLSTFIESQCGILAHSHAPFHHASKLFDESLSSILSSDPSELLPAKKSYGSDFPATAPGPKLGVAHALLVKALQFNAEVLQLFPHFEAPWCGRGELFIAYIRRCSAYANRYSLGTKAHGHEAEGDSTDPKGPTTTRDTASEQTFTTALPQSAEKPLSLAGSVILPGNASADETIQHCRGTADNCLEEFDGFTSRHFHALFRKESIWSFSLVQQDRGSASGEKRSDMVSRWQERHRLILAQELLRAGQRIFQDERQVQGVRGAPGVDFFHLLRLKLNAFLSCLSVRVTQKLDFPVAEAIFSCILSRLPTCSHSSELPCGGSVSLRRVPPRIARVSANQEFIYRTLWAQRMVIKLTLYFPLKNWSIPHGIRRASTCLIRNETSRVTSSFG
ncbi:hypothetical protein TGRUB_311815 [Toxoplasma gondii RUB]|uniref:Uncharacterized protein n=1 Tax=Toxoplasma gondii RUB TaxID=935652 RepID=A0A086MAN7_TOXGO|nr:hypothetical protein TGRUB_311815 [Toxoplasma gondii RUB]